jgi:hypothetical protein
VTSATGPGSIILIVLKGRRNNILAFLRRPSRTYFKGLSSPVVKTQWHSLNKKAIHLSKHIFPPIFGGKIV